MDYKIFTPVAFDLDDKILYYHKKVCEKFNIVSEYVFFKCDNKYNVKEQCNCLNNIVDSCNSEFIVLLEIDCIPLNFNCMHRLLLQISDRNTLAGTVQAANHKIDTDKLYIATSLCGFAKQLYLDCGSPDFNETDYGDTFCTFTDACVKYNKNIVMWDVSSCLMPLWRLGKTGKQFGIGTIYDDCVYHNFSIRFKEYQQYFIDMCDKVLNV